MLFASNSCVKIMSERSPRVLTGTQQLSCRQAERPKINLCTQMQEAMRKPLHRSLSTRVRTRGSTFDALLKAFQYCL
jgi:hypothetical protein